MKESDSVLDHYTEQLRLLIWSGFFDRLEFQTHLDDLEYDEDATRYLDGLREFGEEEFHRKREAESGWPARTDWDRLNDVFEALYQNGILALHNAGYTSGEANADAWQIVRDSAPDAWSGFCFYHGQDVERAVLGMPLYIGFDAVAEGEEAKRDIGSRVATTLREADFVVDWNGDPETRMTITNLDWKKRTESVDYEPRSDADAVEVSDFDGVDEPTRPGLLARLFGKHS